MQGNEKFKNALTRRPQATPPVWFMRQAGRYHRHYHELRAKHSFMELCKNPKLAAQVTLGPIEDFDFDVAIFFSDLLFPLEALGMGLEYHDKTGPELGWCLTEETLPRLKNPENAWPELLFQKEALQETRKILPSNKSLIGFVGSPWTLFTYATQGKHSGSLQQAKTQIPLFSRFCEALTPLLVKNIRLQLDGGAEIVMLFDTAAGELSPWLFQMIVLPQIQVLAREFPDKLGYYSKYTQSSHLNHPLFKSGEFAGIGIDHRWDLQRAFEVSNHGFVQGNFDEALLFADETTFKKYLDTYFGALAKLSPESRAGWVCGLGHGVLPGTPEKNVRLFIKILRETFK